MRQEHAATMRMQLEETLGTFSGYFFVTLFLNEAVQRVIFRYVTRSTSFNDVRFRLHILQPFVEQGHEASNYFNFHSFLMPPTVCYNRNCACPLAHTIGGVLKDLEHLCCNNHRRKSCAYSWPC